MTHFILSTILLLLIHPSSEQNGSGANLTDTVDPSTVSVPELKMEGTAIERFATVMTTIHASGGMATVYQGCSYGAKRNASVVEGTPLGVALDDVAEDVKSAWRVNDGIVNVLPLGIAPALLQTPIHKFVWNRTGSVEEAVGRLLGMPEVRQRVRELGLKESPGGNWSGGICVRDCPKAPEPIPQVETDATLLTILNRIVRSHKGAIWEYTEFFCENEKSFRIGIIAK